MINVLQNWQEVGCATLALQRERLPIHSTAQKNWDHYLLHKLINSQDRRIQVIDLGCGEAHTLKFLYSLGFKNIDGIDFRISWKVRAAQLIRAWRQKALNLPFHLYPGDITKTPFRNDSYDLAVCVSTIEHGVDIKAFLREASRILKPGGLLFLTTDYWEEEVQATNSANAFGLPWKVFSQDEIKLLIRLAQGCGLVLSQDTTIPACSDKTVFWQDSNYTFISLVFKKPAA
jgi:SAM-dependent methyltransferase